MPRRPHRRVPGLGREEPKFSQERRRRAVEVGLARRLTPGYHGPWWTAEELALLGVLPDAEVALRTGRTTNAVRVRRWRLVTA